MLEHDKKLKIAQGLKTYGGSFDRAIAECLILADANNLERLVSAFPEIIAKGLYMADRFEQAEIDKQNGE